MNRSRAWGRGQAGSRAGEGLPFQYCGERWAARAFQGGLELGTSLQTLLRGWEIQVTRTTEAVRVMI